VLANTLYFPQIAFGGGYATTLVIMNTGTSAVSSRINFYDQGGTNRTAYSAVINLPPGGSTRYTLPDTGPLTVVWGELPAGVGTVQGVATFDLRGAGNGLVTTAGVLGLEAGNSFLVPVDVTPTASTGVAIANVNGGSPFNVQVRLLGENASLIATANDVRFSPLIARGQMADFVTNLFPQLNGTTFKGTLIVEAAPGAPNNSLVATALTVKEGLLSALPALSDARSDSGSASVTDAAFPGSAGYSAVGARLSAQSIELQDGAFRVFRLEIRKQWYSGSI
jgi:hypothetical protein